MLSTHAKYAIVEDDFISGSPLVIRDVGPWDQFPTVTNDAEWVVAKLTEDDALPNGRRLFCIDSLGRKDEILHKGGRFVGFAAVTES